MWMDYTDECKGCPKGFCNCCNDPPMARTLKLPDKPDAGSSAIYRLKKSILLILYFNDLIEPFLPPANRKIFKIVEYCNIFRL